ncbi:apoptosis-associated speck-like protein containing a CARD [Triplophysa dalaica]|uniref:apoptosis-associated speck-like protein containing a CARD n=1 Tax=Triplophysa dalaica TaxID=1582913 RepID=UPI0024DFAC4E|nr:apoptosis-associated speck-like protein containing a CARD [Triplophysa dalaica]
MARTLKDHLIDTFDDMTQTNVKKFTRKLCDRSQEPRVRRGAIEKIEDSLDLADLMVDTFTSIGAVTVTIEILQAINCNEQAVSLSEATEQNQQFIDKHRIQLIERVRNVDAILDELLEKTIISQEEYDKIRSKSTPTEKMREIFSGTMISAGNAGKLALYEALMKLQPPLMKDLGAQ